MGTRLEWAGVAFLIGIGALVAFFMIGSFGESGIAGIIALCVSTFLGAFVLVRQHPSAFWYGPAIISLPTFLFFAGPADPGQFKLYIIGMIISLVCGYAGAIVGLRLPRARKVDETKQP